MSGDPWAPDIEMSKTWTLPWRSSESHKYSNDWSPILQEGFPAGSVDKESACNAGDPGSIPGLERSPGEGIGYPLQYSWASAGKESACNVGDLGLIPRLGRSPGEGNGYPLQYSGLENSMDSPWGRTESDTTEVT